MHAQMKSAKHIRFFYFCSVYGLYGSSETTRPFKSCKSEKPKNLAKTCILKNS